jgi:hypothetical protein
MNDQQVLTITEETRRHAVGQLHPDTIRLNHLIKYDRCIIGNLIGNTSQKGVIEKIEFIFDNAACDTGPDAVRAALDRSLQAMQRRAEGGH